MLKTLNNDNFDDEVIKADKPVLVDFFATWCGPCKMMSPVIDNIAEEYEDKIIVGKLDIDDNMDIASKYRIAAVPTLIMFKNGTEVQKVVGMVSKSELIELIESVIR